MNNESGCEDFFENLLRSVMTMCIRQGLKEINEELKSLNKEEFKLIYSPNIPNLLSMLNIFRRSLGNGDDVNLSDSIMLTEDVGSIIGCSLRERTNLIDMVDKKVSSIRVRGGVDKTTYQVMSIPKMTIPDSHHGICLLQTKMSMIQMLFDTYKIISMELPRKSGKFILSSAEIFNRCPSCTNGHLVKGEYQTMVDIVRESLPLKGVTFEHDPIRHEAVKQAGQIKSIETVQLHQEEVKFSKQSKLNRYGMSLDLVPKGTRKYQVSWNDTTRQRTVNNMFNNKKFKLSHILGETVVMDKCSLNATSKLKITERLMIGSCEQPSDRAMVEMRILDSNLNKSNSYYPFRVTNWSDNEKCKISSYFSSIRDESRYQAADSSEMYNHTQYGLNEDNGFELRQAV